jgi:serine/threonine protein kinase
LSWYATHQKPSHPPRSSPVNFAERAVMSLKDLCIKMENEELGPFSLQTLLSILYDVIVGLQFIHSHDIAHRDLNLRNFLIFDDFAVKVS